MIKKFCKEVKETGDLVVSLWKTEYDEKKGEWMGDPERGAISVKVLIATAIGVVVLAKAIPIVWPLIAGSDTDIQAMTGTDPGTSFIQDFWPLLIIVGGLGIGAGVVKLVTGKFSLG